MQLHLGPPAEPPRQVLHQERDRLEGVDLAGRTDEVGERDEVEPGMGADIDDDVTRGEEAAVALPQDALVVRDLTGLVNRLEGGGGGHGRMHAQGPFCGDKSGGLATSPSS